MAIIGGQRSKSQGFQKKRISLGSLRPINGSHRNWRRYYSNLDEEQKFERRKHRLFHRASSGAYVAKKKGEYLIFITLTSSNDSPQGVTAISQSLSKLVKRIKRRFGHFEYIWIREFTKSGLIHLHILARGPYIPQKWLSIQWDEIHKARIVDIRLVRDSGSAVRYMMKYLSKDPVGRFGYSWGWIFRRSGMTWKSVCKYVFGLCDSLEGFLGTCLDIWHRIMDCMLGREREKLPVDEILAFGLSPG